MNTILFDSPHIRDNLKPLTLTRPIAGLRLGILTLAEKWEAGLKAKVSFLTEAYLSRKFQVDYGVDNLYINASVLPDYQIIEEIKNLSINNSITKNGHLIALRTEKKLDIGFEWEFSSLREFQGELAFLRHLPDLFLLNANEIKKDFLSITKDRKSAEIKDSGTILYNLENVFLEDGVYIKAAVINAENGPVYIGKNAVIQEGAIIIGPAAIGEEAIVAFGARIRPNTTLGPVCRVGGEVGNSIFHAYANKAHDGFLGNSYLGEWCNLGANTNNSNLKNDYSEVKLYNYGTKNLQGTGELFCGTFIGDYTKAGISTMFNTGTIAGVCSNIFGAGFQAKFIPSFSWGGPDHYAEYRFEKAIQVIEATMARRDIHLSEAELEILNYIRENKHKELS